MVLAFSNDLRTRFVGAVAQGQSCRSAARAFGISCSTAIRWVARWRKTGQIGPSPQGGDNRSHRLDVYGDEIIALIEETPHTTLVEIVAHLDETHGVTASQSSIWRLLDRRGYTGAPPRANGAVRRCPMGIGRRPPLSAHLGSLG